MDSSLQKTGANLPAKPTPRGLEEQGSREDLIIPRAKLLEALSPEVIEDGKSFQPGLLINSVTKEILPSTFVPIFRFFNWARFNPRNSKDPNFNPDFGPGGLIWRSTDPLDARVISEGKFGPNGERPLAVKFINFFSMFPGVPMPVIVSFSSSSIKAGQQLNSMAQFSGDDMFATSYELTAKLESNDKGTYYVLRVKKGASVKGTDTFRQAEAWYEEYKPKKIQMHEEGEETDTESAPF